VFEILELYTIALHTMSSPQKRPKTGRTKPHFKQLPLECLLHVFRFLYSAHLVSVFRWKEVYTLKDTKQTDSKVKATGRSNYHSLLLMNELSVPFDLHRQQYQHLRVHRCLLEKSADTVNGIYTYLPLIFVYSTLAVSRLPEPEEPEEYMCCPRDQQTIVLTSVEQYTSNRCLSESPDPDDTDLVLTDPDCPHVHCDLPNPHYQMLIDSDLEKNWYGIHCIGDIVDGVVMSYARCPTTQEPLELDTWNIGHLC